MVRYKSLYIPLYLYSRERRLRSILEHCLCFKLEHRRRARMTNVPPPLCKALKVPKTGIEMTEKRDSKSQRNAPWRRTWSWARTQQLKAFSPSRYRYNITPIYAYSRWIYWYACIGSFAWARCTHVHWKKVGYFALFRCILRFIAQDTLCCMKWWQRFWRGYFKILHDRLLSQLQKLTNQRQSPCCINNFIAPRPFLRSTEFEISVLGSELYTNSGNIWNFNENF